MNSIEIAKVSKENSLKTSTINVKIIVPLVVKDTKIHKNKV